MKQHLLGPTDDPASGPDVVMAGLAQQLERPGAQLGENTRGLADAAGVLVLAESESADIELQTVSGHVTDAFLPFRA